MRNLAITPASEDDYSRLLHLNNLAVPNVNCIPTETLAALHHQSIYLGVARTSEEIAGFLLVLPYTADYESPNFQYFKRRYDVFAYVDRIVVDPRLRSSGVGASLYQDLHSVLDILDDVYPLLACEVNLEPPNPGSLRFHERLGFNSVGTQQTEGGSKRVTLLTKALSRNPP